MGMYARVARGQVAPERVEARLRGFREEMVPKLLPRPGFNGIYFMVDRGAAKTLALSFWEHAETPPGPGEDAIRAQAEKHYGGPPAVDFYEVAAEERRGAGPAEGMFARVTTFEGLAELVDAAIERGAEAVRLVQEME